MHKTSESDSLRRFRTMCEALVKQVPAVVYIDDDSSFALYMNPEVERAIGYTEAEWLEDPNLWVKLLHPEDRERTLSGVNRARTTGTLFDAEYRLVARDGSVVWVHDKSMQVEGVVEKGTTKDYSVWQRVILNITERKQMEKERRESEELFKKTFELAGVGMAHVAPDGRWLRVNNKLLEISGYNREELLEMSFLELTPLEDRQASLECIHRMLAGKLGSYSLERRYVRKDGLRIWINLSISLLRKTTGEPKFFICVVEGITERKIAELVPESLTDREMEVLQQITKGRTNSQIAEDLCHSLGTVKLAVQKILCKLSVTDRIRATNRAIEIGLIPPLRYEK